MQVLRPLARIWTTLLTLTALVLGLGLVARWLLPIGSWDAGATVNRSTPADGATGVLPQSAIGLEFSVAMNRASAQAALELTPATPGTFHWSDDARQLIFTPTSTLIPDTDYTLRIGSAALSRWWHPLDRPYEIRFHTAPLPAVIAALPHSSNTPLDSALAVVFSQPMVAPNALNQPITLPQLQIEPAVNAQLRWIDQMTLLVQPDTPLRAASHYTATITPDLTDLRGVALGEPFRWGWSTSWPLPLAYSPTTGARWVGPHQPIRLTLAAPLDEDLLRSALVIDPPAEFALSTALVSATQVITLTPQTSWAYDTSYQIRFSSGDPDLAQAPDLDWSFRVEPRPGLIAFFPGQGQSLSTEQDVRLIFSTPMDEAALRTGLKIDPPVDEPGLRVYETEVRLRPALQPSQTYTITVAAATRDRSGEPLGVTETIRLRAAAAEPGLRAPAASAHVISLPVSQTVRVMLERINLSQLHLSLYQLDVPTVVRALSLTADEWENFSPERYGQQLARNWQLSLSDPRDTLIRDPITVALNADEPLPAGFYYLRVRAREGPHIDLLLQVSQLNLTLRQSESQVLVWATDQTSGKPLANVPILLYAGEVLVTRGQTNSDGSWEQPIRQPEGGGPYLVLADGANPALVRSDWLAAPVEPQPPRYHTLLFLNQPAYRPGDSVQLGGFVRMHSSDQRMVLPATDANCRMRLESDNPSTPSVSTSCTLSPTGTISGTLQLGIAQPAGDYQLLVQVGDSSSSLALQITGAQVDSTLAFVAAEGDMYVRATRSDRPLVGATISWTLDLEPLTASDDPEGFHFDQTGSIPPPSSGSGTTDAEGMLAIALPDSERRPLRYRLQAALRSGEQVLVSEQHEGQILPDEPQVGLRLASRVVSTSERAIVAILTLDTTGQPAAGQTVDVAVYRNGSSEDAPVISRRTISDSQGRAGIQLVQLQPGAYTVAATLGGQSSQVDLWVAGGRYSSWKNPPGQVAVIIDRDSYRPGEVARLLVSQPYARAHLLLSSERGDLHSLEVRELTASQLITLTITPEMAPAINIGAVVASGSERLVGTTSIQVIDEQPELTLTLATDAVRYTPASSATLSITASLGGAPIAADVLVRIGPAADPSSTSALRAIRPVPPIPLTTAMLRAGGAPPIATQVGAQPTRQGDPAITVPFGVQSSPDGQFSLRVPLPNSNGDWRISVYAITREGQIATSSLSVTTREPLELTLSAPHILRTGDQAMISLLVRNTSAISQSLRLSLETTGGTIDSRTPGERQLWLVAGGAQRLSWRISPQVGAQVVQLRYTLNGEQQIQELSRELPVEPEGAIAATSVATSEPIILQQEYLDAEHNTPIDPAHLPIGTLLRLRISVISTGAMPSTRLEIPLPGGLQPIKLRVQAPFGIAEPTDTTRHSLQFTARQLGAGVYTISALLRADAVGEFYTPGARLHIGETAAPAVILPAGPDLIVVEEGQP